jgi:antitoxin (DNA-binding transcriptional repressor) of toxin-antitoxin stability system
MKAISVAELKNNLILYLDEVKAGERIEVREGDQPIALIVPTPRDEQDEELLALAAQGKIRLGEGPIEDSFWDLPAPEVPMDVLQRVVKEERDGQWR